MPRTDISIRLVPASDEPRKIKYLAVQHQRRRGRSFDLRINHGPGYRVYCGQDGDTLVLLLCAGDKRSQAKDIDRAKTYWIDYLERRQPPVQRG